MEKILYIITLSIFFAFVVALLCWVQFALYQNKGKSRWKKQQLLLHAGVLINIAVSLLCYFWFYVNFEDQGPNRYFVLINLVSALAVPQCGLSLLSLSDRRVITHGTTLLHYLVPVIFLVTYACVVDCDHCSPAAYWVEHLAWFYNFIYALYIVVSAARNARKFSVRLEESYVDGDRRQVLRHFEPIFLYACVFFLWAAFVFFPSYKVHAFYFSVSSIFWCCFTYVVLNIEDSPLAQTMKEPLPAGEKPEPVPTQTDMLNDSPVIKHIDEILDRVLHEENLYLNANLDINMLAQALCTNRTYVGRVFRMRGTTFSRYVNALRLNHAEDLLRGSSKTVNEISAECGFSEATFRRLFYERFQCTPLEYRKTISAQAKDSQ